EQGTSPAMTRVEGAGMTPVQTAHPLGDTATRRLQDEVIVRVHETRRVESPRSCQGDSPKTDPEELTVDVVGEPCALRDSPRSQVVDAIRVVLTRESAHPETVPENSQRVCKVSDTFWCQTPVTKLDATAYDP